VHLDEQAGTEALQLLNGLGRNLALLRAKLQRHTRIQATLRVVGLCVAHGVE